MELMEDVILKTLMNKGSKLSSHDILGNYSKYVIIHSCDMHVYTKLHDTHQIFFLPYLHIMTDVPYKLKCV